MRRYRSAEIPFTEIQLTLGSDKRNVYTDGNGYFHYRWPTPPTKEIQQPWTTVTLQPADTGLSKAQKYTVAEILIPYESAEFGVVSDVDDTIMQTGATSFLKHTKTVLLNNVSLRLERSHEKKGTDEVRLSNSSTLVKINAIKSVRCGL